MIDDVYSRERLESLISQKIEESHLLDYKAAAGVDNSERKKTDITKDVSAFANSAGGRTIYGVKEYAEPERKHLPEKIDSIDGRAFPREWLDDIIGQISPPIQGIKIVPVRVGPNDWDTCYVVNIPQGEIAHQARDRIYYRRHNFKSVPMLDHEIRDVMNRLKHPKLALMVHLKRTPHATLQVSLCVRNRGKVCPRQYGIVVFLPAGVEGALYKEDLIHAVIDGKHYWRFMVVGKEPSFPGADTYCKVEVPYAIGRDPGPVDENMHCALYADEMPAFEKRVPVKVALQNWA